MHYFKTLLFLPFLGFVLGNWHKSKGGHAAHTAQEEATVWRAGECVLCVRSQTPWWSVFRRSHFLWPKRAHYSESGSDQRTQHSTCFTRSVQLNVTHTLHHFTWRWGWLKHIGSLVFSASLLKLCTFLLVFRFSKYQKALNRLHVSTVLHSLVAHKN